MNRPGSSTPLKTPASSNKSVLAASVTGCKSGTFAAIASRQRAMSADAWAST